MNLIRSAVTITLVFAGLTGIALADRRCEWSNGPVICCDQLRGIAKSECERRDTVDDYAPAGVTPSMREKQLRAREEAGLSNSDCSSKRL